MTDKPKKKSKTGNFKQDQYSKQNFANIILKGTEFMNKFYVLFLLSLILTACHIGSQSGKPELNRDRCIIHWFEQGDDDILYGIKCLEGKKLFIQTYKEGQPVVTTSAVSKESGQESLKLEGDVKFKNKFYEVGYKILKNQGDYKHPAVKPFLPLQNLQTIY